MRQAIMTSPCVIQFRDVPVPTPGPDEVLLRIQRIGICGSDIHVYHGKHPFTSYPIVQGHEYSATVEAVGRNVTSAKPGMRATACPQVVCGECGPCLRGQYNVCQKLKVQGFQANGCAQELFVVPEDRLVVFPESMSYEQGALIEPAAVAAHSTSRASALKGKNVVVAGAGTIGNLVAQFVQARGAARVLITDLSDFRLGIAQQCGIRYTANVAREPFEMATERVFSKEGFQVGFEAVGVQATMDNLISGVEKGGEIVVLGVFEEHPRVNMGFVGEHELRIVGTMMYRHDDYDEAVQMISRNRIVTGPLVTMHFPFEEFLAAYTFIEMQGDKTMKIMIDVAE
jgi:2-desacetyl-2-hydroxyethyl bacteriochlorophyllide A dehydrogenase